MLAERIPSIFIRDGEFAVRAGQTYEALYDSGRTDVLTATGTPAVLTLLNARGRVQVRPLAQP